MYYKSFKHTCIGESHLEKKTKCQDFSLAAVISDCAFAVVSDGLGSKKHFRSDIGSRYACFVAFEIVSDFFDEIENEDMNAAVFNHEIMMHHLAVRILSRWREYVMHHKATNPFDENEQKIIDEFYADAKADEDYLKAYACTFVLAVMSEHMNFIIQTGDSRCIVFDNTGHCDMPAVTDNPINEMGGTTTLSDSLPLENFRYFWAEEAPRAMFVCSDGVLDSYEKEKLLIFLDTLLKEFLKDHACALNQLKDFLPRMSKNYSRDDVSIAGVYTFNPME